MAEFSSFGSALQTKYSNNFSNGWSQYLQHDMLWANQRICTEAWHCLRDFSLRCKRGDKRDKRPQHTDYPLTKWNTVITQQCVFSDEKVPLYNQCEGRPQNECLDSNAQCDDGRCLCVDTHFDKNGICGERSGGPGVHRNLNLTDPFPPQIAQISGIVVEQIKV